MVLEWLLVGGVLMGCASCSKVKTLDLVDVGTYPRNSFSIQLKHKITIFSVANIWKTFSLAFSQNEGSR